MQRPSARAGTLALALALAACDTPAGPGEVRPLASGPALSTAATAAAGSIEGDFDELLGMLDGPREKPLAQKVEGARAAYRRGNHRAATGQLGAFANQTRAFVGTGKLEPAGGRVYLDRASVLGARIDGGTIAGSYSMVTFEGLPLPIPGEDGDEELSSGTLTLAPDGTCSLVGVGRAGGEEVEVFSLTDCDYTSEGISITVHAPEPSDGELNDVLTGTVIGGTVVLTNEQGTYVWAKDPTAAAARTGIYTMVTYEGIPLPILGEGGNEELSNATLIIEADGTCSLAGVGRFDGQEVEVFSLPSCTYTRDGVSATFHAPDPSDGELNDTLQGTLVGGVVTLTNEQGTYVFVEQR